MKNLFIDQYKKIHPNKDKWEFCYITPEEMILLQEDRGKDGTEKLTYKELVDMAKRADSGNNVCDCGNDRVWEFGNLGMCFSCVTGETDRSEDFELTLDIKKQPHYEA